VLPRLASQTARISTSCRSDGSGSRCATPSAKEAPDLGPGTPNDAADLRIGPQQITGVQDLVQQRIIR
jgi:hypothetical protein